MLYRRVSNPPPTYSILKMVIIEGIQRKVIRRDIDPTQLALIIWSQIHGVITIASREGGVRAFQTFLHV